MNINKLKYIPLLVMALLLNACDFGDTNIDPDNPADAPQESLLPSVQAHMAFAFYGDGSRFAGQFTQHFTGTANQSFNFSQYDFFSKDVVNFWRNLYEDSYPDIQLIISKSAEDGATTYSGVGKVMKAYWLGSTTDLFGDVPYTEANQGIENLSPVFDSQESLYAEVHRLLNEGISELSDANSTRNPGGEDFLYGGDLGQWIKFARVLQARNHLHLVMVNGNSAASDALAAINAGAFESSEDDADFLFTSTEGNPLAQFEASRAGDIRTGEFFVELMKDKNDPRLASFIAQNGDGEFVGSPVQKDLVSPDASAVGPYYAEPTTPVSFASYTEMKFIEAEALLRVNGANDPDANAAFREAIEASLTKVGIDATDITDYMADKNLTGDFENNLRQIIEEKYVALFNNFETFTDWRRTGYPQLESATGGTIPVRFPYSQESVNFNSNTPEFSITEPVWWDK